MNDGNSEKSKEGKGQGKRWRRGQLATERDLEIVRWVGRCRFASAAQVQRRFGLAESKAYERLRGRSRDGLLSHRRVLHGKPGVYAATRAGLRVAGLDALPTATIALQSFEHEIAVVDQLVRLERGGHLVLTEREMRAADRPERFAVDMGLANGRLSVHRPDLALSQDGGWWGVEVELTAKTPKRMEAILRGYRRVRSLTGVVYLVPNQRALERLQLVSERVHLGERIRLGVIGQEIL